MGERSRTRALVVSRAIAARLRPKAPPAPVRRVLVAHNLLLGDTLMLTPLLAKLREQHQYAAITLLAAPPFVPLYGKNPYGVQALPFSPHRSETTRALLDEEPFDVAYVPGDNRYTWLAAAMRARHIVVHSGPRPLTQEWFADEKHPYSATPAAWGDMVSGLAEGGAPSPYARGDWPAPDATEFELPRAPYVVLHVGASTPLKFWMPDRWLALAIELQSRGYDVVWSGGRGEEAFTRECDPQGRFRSYAGKLDLAQMWRLLERAALLVVPDTGISHLGRATWTPTVTLFGPGSAVLAGPGTFWRDTPWRSVTVDPFPCRDQQMLFGRPIEWVRRCARNFPNECPEPKCMQAITLDAVVQSIDALLEGQRVGNLER